MGANEEYELGMADRMAMGAAYKLHLDGKVAYCAGARAVLRDLFAMGYVQDAEEAGRMVLTEKGIERAARFESETTKAIRSRLRLNWS